MAQCTRTERDNIHKNGLQAMTSSSINTFLDALAARGFRGDTGTTQAERSVYATDNSIYFRLPQAVLFPRDHADVEHIMALVGSAAFRDIHIVARGGGTGTNGQSLTDGIVIDLSRHMNRIIHIDAGQRRAVVEAGVVKDQLNAALKAHGLFFAPELSTSNRATIGGMINTDACGQGSCTYGKTRHHVLALQSVLLGGETLHSAALPRAGWQTRTADKTPKQQHIYHSLYQLADNNRALIARTFPPLNRSLSGYDLPNLLNDNTFNINSVLCGAEGSLAIITQATLNLLPIPRHRVLINIGYADFMAALSDARTLMAEKPLSIETVDSTVLALARNDWVWESVAAYIPAGVQGINLVELTGDSENDLHSKLAAFLARLAADTSVTRQSCTQAYGADIEHIYHMRKRAVGLLGNVQGEARPQPFVEDTAVPPEHLPEFIAEFRAILDNMGLAYGMFGHVDAGVLHVRPVLDMKNPQSAEKIRQISDKVAALTQRYGGVLWGEHGKGLRSAYAPAFFGDAYPLAQRVKALFDPHNQLNPGKIATPDPHTALTGLTDITLRGTLDRAIPARDWQQFGATMHCNGNGACFNYDHDDPMCPSWKATRDRRHSPKGRATLIKEWLHSADAQQTPRPRLIKPRAQGLASDVYDALHGCLSCKSCSGQCPVKVDIPDSKARFLERHHQRYRRPLRDHLIASLETIMPRLAPLAALYNTLQNLPGSAWLQRRLLGLVDAPRFTPQTTLPDLPHLTDPAQLENSDPHNSVILIQDAFTRHFDTTVWRDWLHLLQTLGLHIWLMPYRPSGKPLHVHGFLQRFMRTARDNSAHYARFAASGIPLIGLDPAITLIYRQEYRQTYDHQPPAPHNWHIHLPQEWLADWLDAHHPPAPASNQPPYYLAAHCMEKTQTTGSARAWQRIFAHFGLELHEIKSGCCGMSGTYGHEAEHRALSATIYAQSWREKIAQHQDRLLATGYSCRSQIKREDQRTALHPLQAILQEIQKNKQKTPT